MHSLETRQKISNSLKGHKVSEKVRQILSDNNRKNRGKSYDEKYGKDRALDIKEKIRNSNKGKILSDIQKKKISNKLKGHKQREETIQKRAISLRGDKNPSKRLDVRKKLSEKMLLNIKLGKANINKMIKKDTKPELIFESILISRNINYVKQFVVENKFFDFYLPNKNLLVEIHGDYWHANPKINFASLSKAQIRNTKNDLVKKEIARKNGYRLICIWENCLKEGSETREMSPNNNSLQEHSTSNNLDDDIVRATENDNL